VSGAVLAPGYGGSADQPIIRALAARLEARGIVTSRIAFSTRGRRPSGGYATELGELRAARDALAARAGRPLVLAGRSFGGRMCVLLAAAEPPDAVVVLGHPISPPGRPRPADEAALRDIRCPTLIVQGDQDELGPLAVLERLAGVNPRIDLVALRGVGHDFGSREREAVDAAARWLEAILQA